ncbi:MAG: hypothetical protein J6V11_05260, partial [Alphaproteobacteria bacterium]|nr:hypothetical protein [Alphaproteobacteria bacterium]
KMPRTMQNVIAQMPMGFAAFDKYQRSFTMPTSSIVSVNETHRLKMAPEAREWDSGIYGQFNLAENIRAKMQGLVRFNREHQAGVKPDYQVMFGLNWLFN